MTAEDIQEVLLKSVSYKNQTHVPGSETDHYQPSTPVHVFNSKKDLEQFLSTHDAAELSLKPIATEASKEFYTLLRALDKKAKYICVYFNPSWTSERWAGLKNRLLKSSSQWSK
ncbi:MAG: Sua5 family C-terminal domain-containing protein [Bdellovibrionales bacterium]